MILEALADTLLVLGILSISILLVVGVSFAIGLAVDHRRTHGPLDARGLECDFEPCEQPATVFDVRLDDDGNEWIEHARCRRHAPEAETVALVADIQGTLRDAQARAAAEPPGVEKARLSRDERHAARRAASAAEVR
jgi:hypothetical protein